MVEVKQRIKYIDVMRAFTMFLVVMQHIDAFAMTGYSQPIHKLLIAVRMPMFFFVSGYIGYKSLDYWTCSNYVVRLRKKSFVQLVPASIFFLLSALIFCQDPIAIFAKDGFQKYWFTYVLFYMFCIYFSLSLLCRSSRIKSHWLDVVLVMLSSMMWLVYIRSMWHPIHHCVWNILYADRLCHFFVFFVVGTLCRKHLQSFHRLIDHPLGIGAVVVLFGGCVYLLFTPWLVTEAPNLFNYFVQMFAVSVLGVVVVYACFYRLRHILDNGSRLSNALAFAGRRTLDVYLLHYFFIPGCAPYLAFGIGPFASSLLAALVSIGLTATIYALCLGVSWLIRRSPTLSHWMLGADKP